MSFLLDDTEDVKSKTKKALKAMGALNFKRSTEYIPIETKIKLCAYITLNLVLGGGEN